MFNTRTPPEVTPITFVLTAIGPVVLAALIGLALIAITPVAAKADTIATLEHVVAESIACSNNRLCTNSEEAKMIQDAAKKVQDQDQKNGKTIKGNEGLNGFPTGGTISVGFLDPGTTATLTFEWLNPQTLLPTTGPTIGSVIYEYSQTPDIPSSFTPLGTSSNPLTDFALQYTAFSTEEAIVAIPLDASGVPIYIPDVDGIGNLAPGLAVQLVGPEPSSLLLFGTSVMGIATCMAARHRRNS